MTLHTTSRQRIRRADGSYTWTSYAYEDCRICGDPLHCPYPICLAESRRNYFAVINSDRDARIAQLAADGMSRYAISKLIPCSIRTVYRVLGRGPSPARRRPRAAPQTSPTAAGGCKTGLGRGAPTRRL